MGDKDNTDFQFLAENSVDILCRVGPDGIKRYVSPSSYRILGWTPEEMVGTGPEAFVISEDLPIIVSAADHRLISEFQNSTSIVRMRKKSGGTVWMEINAHLVNDARSGAPLEVVLVMRDISERKLKEEKLLALMLTDEVTGLLNRRGFDEALERECKRTLREGSYLSLLMADMDHFTEINELYGYEAGDNCLQLISAVIRRNVRATDITARYDGDEIAVILPKADTDGALMVAERVRAAIETLSYPNEGNPEGKSCVTMSIGVATANGRFCGTMGIIDNLLRTANNALSRAKSQGRNCVITNCLVNS